MNALNNFYYSYVKVPSPNEVFVHKHYSLGNLPTDTFLKIATVSFTTICMIGTTFSWLDFETDKISCHELVPLSSALHHVGVLAGFAFLIYSAKIHVTAEEQLMRQFFNDAIDKIELAKSIGRNGFKKKITIVNVCNALQSNMRIAREAYAQKIRELISVPASMRAACGIKTRLNKKLEKVYGEAGKTINISLGNLQTLIADLQEVRC